MRGALKRAFPAEAEVMMNTLAERWIEQGKAAGEEKGAARTVLNLLQHRFGPIGLDLSEQIQQLAIADLDRLVTVALDASTLNAVSEWVEARLDTDGRD